MLFSADGASLAVEARCLVVDVDPLLLPMTVAGEAAVLRSAAAFDFDSVELPRKIGVDDGNRTRLPDNGVDEGVMGG